MHWRTLVVLSFLLAAGCYRSVPLTTPSPETGTEVVVHLTDAGAVRLAPLLGAQLARVRGRVTDASESAVALSVIATVNRAGNEALWRGEPVTIPRELVSSIALRRVDRRRTTLVTLLALAGVVVAGSILGGGSGFDGFLGGGGGPRQ